MRILIVGGGGREHALAWSVAKSPLTTALFVAPGNAGTARFAKNLPVAATDIEGQVRAAKENKIDFVIVAPDDPLALGLVDKLNQAGIRAFGPTAAAARIESSKIFSKNLMKKYDIPTAAFETFADYEQARAYVETCELPVVIKADGLALGKGVVIAKNRDEAFIALRDMMQDQAFGKAGANVVIESFMTGREVTWLVLTDGEHALPLPSSQDHKRAFDGDQGPNTGGMGAIAPSPYFTDALQKETMEKIVTPTLRALKAEGATFKGVLYFGLMLTPDGVRVVEYNARFGDPEAQAILPLIESDIVPLLMATTDGTLAEQKPRIKSGSCVCVVLASGGYPGRYKTGFPIRNLPEAERRGATVFHAGTAIDDEGNVITKGGRVLGVTACAPTLYEAIEAAYNSSRLILFDNMMCRTDIGRT